MTDYTEVARALGVKPDEIVDVTDSPAGLLITTAPATTYIEVPADRPDADGKTGLMFLAAPTERYRGTFPVYAQPGAAEAPAVVEDDACPTGGTPEEILAWVAGDLDRAQTALSGEAARGGRPRKKLIGELEQIVEQWGPRVGDDAQPGAEAPVGVEDDA